ncbi:MAG TPA: extracellular solute-binding protein [Gaiellaceae bacterium]|nr:extracellular solute-binding protein [Gaiellaceae bacterium]
MDKQDLEPEQSSPEEAAAGEKVLSRSTLLKTAGATGAGLLIGGMAGKAKAWTPASYNRALAKNRLAKGMVGGPTGFPGAQRYQYGPNTAAGRAIAGLRRLTNNGKKPLTLSWRIWNGAVGQLNVPFPKGAPAVSALLEKEAGVKIKFIQDTPDNNEQKNLQTLSTRDGSVHILQTQITDNGDYAEGKMLRNLDEFVAKYKPDWADPKWGYAGGATTVALMNKYNGSVYSVSFDGDYQVWVYRIDLFDNSQNQKDFKAKYGYDLTDFPKTWKEHDDVAEFFTRPDKQLYGSGDLKNPYWGYVNWMMRYVTAAAPNQHYFDTNAKPLINSAAGIRATQEHVRSLAWTYPDALSKSWPEQYAAMGAGQLAMASMFSNCTKFIPGNPSLDKGFGKYLRTALAPGRMVGGKLVRRSVIYFNAQFAVNAFSNSKLHEAAYLVLQWAGSGHIFTWMAGNPAGYFDPHGNAQFNDPLVRASYKPFGCDELKIIVPNTAPPIAGMRGANDYTASLDTNLQKALTKQITPAQAMANTAAAWEKTTNRYGRAKQARAIQAGLAAWPTGYKYG